MRATAEVARAHPTRAQALARVESRLRRHGFPRLQMLFLVTLTGVFGLLASYCMLSLGVDAMAVRYPLALACAYLFFLLLIWLWLRTNAQDYQDLPDLTGLGPSDSPCAPPADCASGGGGDFGGGGATGAFDASSVGSTASREGAGDALAEAAGTIGEAEEFAIPLAVIAIAVALAVGLAFASFYIVYIAPVLFAEVLVDGVLAYALFRHLKSEDRRYWLTSVLRSTLAPFALTAAFVALSGLAMSWYAPEATSIGQVFKHASENPSAR